jgi:Transglycosylase SLT domain
MSRNDELARIAKRHGMNYSLRIILEARRTKLPISLAFAVIEKESGGRNVYGHDKVRNPIKSPPGGLLKVTPKNYRTYLWHRNRGEGAQGVGPAQLTSPGLQDMADKRGGCHIAKHNIAVAFDLLARLIDRYGEDRGLAAYNAGEMGWRNGRGYANAVQSLQAKWHRRLT